MGVIQKPEQTTLGNIHQLRDLSKKIYTPDEIKNFDLTDAINESVLARKPTSQRSKLAYKELLKNLKPTTKYLLPGQIVLFGYHEPKLKEELDYYDGTPLTLFFGITRTDDGNIREIGLNLHYFPPFARARMLEHTFNTFRPYFESYFNEASTKPNTFISYKRLKHIMRTNEKMAFGIKMYIPTLRGNSYLIPTRLLPIAYYTEGHFSKATLGNIWHFWRKF